MKIVILGAGEVGAYLARVLSSHAEIILIDRNPAALAAIEDGLDVLTVLGDITHRKVLKQAGVQNANLVCAVTGSDDANLVGAALASEVGAPRTVARVDDASFYQSEHGVEAGVLGIFAVLCAARLVGDEVIRQITATDAHFVHGFARNALQLASIVVKEVHPVCTKPMNALGLVRGCWPALVIRDGRPQNPSEISRVELGDQLVLAGEPLQVLMGVRQLVGAQPKRGMIVGGGDVGLQLARMLSACEKRVQVIEKSRERAEFLAEHLKDVNVLCGDGSSIATLRDEHVESVDYLAALTRSDEVNLMVSLVARDLGVHETYTLVHRPGYEEVYRHLGVLGTTGPHDVLSQAILRFLPQGRHSAPVAFPGTKLECWEFSVPEQLSDELPRHRLALPPETFLIGRVDAAQQLVAEAAPITAGQTLIIAAAVHQRKELEHRIGRLGGRA